MAVKVKVEALDLISQLGQEMIVAYEAEDETVATIVAALLDFQLRTPEITVGTISGSYSALTRSIKVDGDTILRALYKLHSTVGGYIHVDNDRQLQWEDSIGEDKGQQLRYNKNLKGIERDINYRGLINRLYAYGAGEGTARIKLSDAEGQDEDYVQDQTSHDTWGGWYPGSLVDISITHPDTLLAWANLRLAEIKDPIISYSVNVIDLSESDVAEFSFDALQLGSIVNVIDEDLGIDVSVSVVKITHNDLANPQNMTLELSSRVKDITDTLMEVYDIQQFQQHIATVIGAGQVIVKGTFTVLDWATGGETTIDGSNIETGTVTLGMLNFIPLTSEGGTEEIIATINATVEGGLRISADKISIAAGRSIFKQDSIPTSLSVGDLWFDTNDDNKLYRADSIGADEITAGEWELVRDDQIATNAASITVNETQISLNVTDISNLEGDMVTAEAAIVVNANAISLEVTNRTNADSTLQGQITVNAGNIVLKVSKNDVINQINISIEGIKIQADNISISGATTFSAGYDPTDKVPEGGAAADVNAGVTTISGGKITTNTLSAAAIMTSSLGAKTITLNGASSILKSSDYSAGSAGWQIKGDGDAEFNEVKVRGSIYTSSIIAGNTLTISGTIAATNLTIDANGITFKTETKCRFYSGGTFVGTMGAQSTSDLRIATASGKDLTIYVGQGTGDLWLQAATINTANPIYCGTIDCGDLLPTGTTGTKMFGHTTKRWANMYGVLGNFTGIVTVGGLSSSGAISGAAGTFSGLLKGQGVQPYSANQDVGISGNRFRHGFFSSTVGCGDIEVGLDTGGKITGPSGAGSRHGTASYYPEQTHSDEWVLHCNIPSFSQFDDLALLRSIQEKDGKLDTETFPDMLCVPPDMALENAVIDAHCKGKSQSEQKAIRQEAAEKLARKAISMANWDALNMGAILELADKYDELKARVDALN